jgi:hypothetical protein
MLSGRIAAPRDGGRNDNAHDGRHGRSIDDLRNRLLDDGAL